MQRSSTRRYRAQYSRTTRRGLIAAAAAAFVAVPLLAHFQPASAAQLDVALIVLSDGGGPASAPDGPGMDASTANGIVRTGDIVTLEVVASVNDVDGQNVRATIDLTSNLTFASAELPAACVATGTPVSSITPDRDTMVCNLGDLVEGTTVSFPVSVRVPVVAHGTSFTVDATLEDDSGSSINVLAANLGGISPNTFFASAAPNVNIELGPSTAAPPSHGVPVKEVSTGSGAAGQLVGYHVRVTSAANGLGGAPLDPNFSFTFDYSAYITDSDGALTGDYPLPNVRVVDNAATPPALDVVMPTSSLGHNGCGPSTEIDVALHGSPTLFPPITTVENSTPNSGTWVCSAGPPGILNVTVTGADFLTPPPVWSNSQTGVPVSVSGMIYLFIPNSDFPPPPYTLAQPATVSISATSSAVPVVETQLADNTAHPQLQVYPDGFFTPYAGIVNDYATVRYDPSMTYAPIVGTNTNRFKYPNSRGMQFPWESPWLLPDETAAYMDGGLLPGSPTGNATVVPGQVVSLHTNTGGLLPTGPTDITHCTVFDNERSRLTNGPAQVRDIVLDIDPLIQIIIEEGNSGLIRVLEAMFTDEVVPPDWITVVSDNFVPATQSGPVWVDGYDPIEGTYQTADIPMVEGVHYEVEYGVSNYLVPNQGQWFGGNTLTSCSDADSSIAWTTDPNLIPDLGHGGGMAEVNMVRMRTLNGYYPASTTNRVYLDMDVWVEVLPSSIGTIVPMWHTFTTDDYAGYPVDAGAPAVLDPINVATPNWIATHTVISFGLGGNYNPATNAGWHRIGDRAIVSGVQVGVKTTAMGPHLENVPVLRPGDVHSYSIDATSGGSGTINQSQIAVTLPPGHTYVPGSASVTVNPAWPLPANAEPIMGGPGDFYWDFGDLPAGSSIHIEYDARTSTNAAESLAGQEYEYIARWHSPSITQVDLPPPSFSAVSDSAFLNISSNGRSLSIQTTTSTPAIRVGDNAQFQLAIQNTGTNPVDSLGSIHVLPFNGDNNIDTLVNRDVASSFNGSLQLSSVSTSVPTLVLYTTTPPSLIEQEAFHPSNAIPGGSTVWCEVADAIPTLPQFGDPGCPASIADATAIYVAYGLIIGQPSLNPGDQLLVDLSFATAGNVAGDMYTANFGTSLTNNLIRVFSNDATVVVQSASVGDLIWLDINANGIQDVGEPGIEGVTVELLDDATGSVVATTTTNANGNYYFTNLLADTYRLRVSAPPAGYSLAGTDVGSDDTLDSDFLPSGETAAFVLGGNTVTNAFDGAYVPSGDTPIVKTTTTPTVAVGGTAVFTIQVTNTVVGGQTVPTEFVDTMPAGFIATSASGEGWTCDIGDGSVVRCAHPGSASTAGTPPVQLTARVTSAAADASTNVVVGGWVYGDNDSTNNISTAGVTVTRSAGATGSLAATGVALFGAVALGLVLLVGGFGVSRFGRLGRSTRRATD